MKLRNSKIALFCLTLASGQSFAEDNKSYFYKVVNGVKSFVLKPVTLGLAGAGAITAAVLKRDAIKSFINWDQRSNLSKFGIMAASVTGIGYLLNKFISYTVNYNFIEFLKTDKNNGKTPDLDSLCRSHPSFKSLAFTTSLIKSSSEESKMARVILNNYAKYYLELPESNYLDELNKFELFRAEIRKYLTAEQKYLYSRSLAYLIEPRFAGKKTDISI